MNFSIVVPQIFYDFIARIIPGLVFLLFLSLGFPMLSTSFYINGAPVADNFIVSLGQGVGYAILSYFLGWLFSTFTFVSRQIEIKNKYDKENNDEKSLNIKYQWIRLSYPEAGFRIVKLRAEARMVEAVRTAMLVLIVIGFIYLLYFAVFDRTLQVSWLRSAIFMIFAAISAYGFRKCETKVWEYYWGNISRIYKILHDKKDPIVNVYSKS